MSWISKVSIPKGEATNFTTMYSSFLKIIVSIPKGEATNTKMVDWFHAKNAVSIPKGEATNATLLRRDLTSKDVSIPKGEATNRSIDMDNTTINKFQSPKGRLQTNPRLHISYHCYGFNPQRGGYKPRTVFPYCLLDKKVSIPKGEATNNAWNIVPSFLKRSFQSPKGRLQTQADRARNGRNKSSFNPQRGGYKLEKGLGGNTP